jgi:hypothetical protein
MSKVTKSLPTGHNLNGPSIPAFLCWLKESRNTLQKREARSSRGSFSAGKLAGAEPQPHIVRSNTVKFLISRAPGSLPRSDAEEFIHSNLELAWQLGAHLYYQICITRLYVLALLTTWDRRFYNASNGTTRVRAKRPRQRQLSSIVALRKCQSW